MTQKYPIAILSPHGGLAVPPEVNGRIALTPEQRFNEADAYADDLFDFRDRVLYYETFPYARAIIDVNRPGPEHASLHHRPGDGVVKHHSSYGDPTYLPDQLPDAELEAQLIDTYWRPWHEKLTHIANDTSVKLVIDCHTMAATGPAEYDDPYKLRPRIMVGNLGEPNGAFNQARGFVTAPPQMACWFAHALGSAIEQVEPLVATGPISAVNEPFFGGWNIWAHGRREAQPWLMIELSRAMYIGHQTANTAVVPADKTRITHLRDCMWQAIVALVERYG